MNSYNGPDSGNAIPGGAGHSDILAPSGCNPLEFEDEIIMPLIGEIVLYHQTENGGNQYDIELPRNTCLQGIVEALIFARVKNPDLNKIESFKIRMGHINIVEGNYLKSETIGDMVYGRTVLKTPMKVAYEIRLVYDGTLYKLSPNLFISSHDWYCLEINNGCDPISLFYETR